jgi:monoamine oxidase
VQAVNRSNRQEQLKAMATAQLARLFGKSALSPLEVYIQDWAFESYTSTKLDQQIQRFHPANNIVDVTEKLWDERLIWSGSESSDYRQKNNGFLEGALEASTRSVALLSD